MFSWHSIIQPVITVRWQTLALTPFGLYLGVIHWASSCDCTTTGKLAVSQRSPLHVNLPGVGGSSGILCPHCTYGQNNVNKNGDMLDSCDLTFRETEPAKALGNERILPSYLRHIKALSTCAHTSHIYTH